MKKLLKTILLLLSVNLGFAQNNKITIDDCINRFEIHGPSGVICSNVDRKKWFTLKPNYKLDGNRLSCSGFIVLKLNIGSLSKNSQLSFSFKDGSKLKLKSKNESEVTSIFYFELTELEFVIIKSKEIKSIRYINGIDNVSFQYKMHQSETNYYTNLFNNYLIRKNYCK